MRRFHDEVLRRISSERAKRGYVVLALYLLPVSVVGWPLSALTLAKGEPPFVLGLSWVAIIIGAFDVLINAQTRREVGE